MCKFLVLTVVLTSCLTGCDVSATVTPRLVQEHSVRQPRVMTATSQTRHLLPTKKRILPPSAEAASKATEGAANANNPASGEASATGGAAASDTEHRGAGPTLLALAAGPTEEVQVIPILDDEGLIERLMFKGGNSQLTWTVQASNGASAQLIGKVKITATLDEVYPLPEEPESSASAEADPEASPAAQEVEVPHLSAVVSPGDIGFPTEIAPGARQALTLDLQSDFFKQFLGSVFAVARFTVTLELLDDNGQPILTEQGEPLTLKHAVQAL